MLAKVTPYPYIMYKIISPHLTLGALYNLWTTPYNTLMPAASSVMEMLNECRTMGGV